MRFRWFVACRSWRRAEDCLAPSMNALAQRYCGELLPSRPVGRLPRAQSSARSPSTAPPCVRQRGAFLGAGFGERRHEPHLFGHLRRRRFRRGLDLRCRRRGGRHRRGRWTWHRGSRFGRATAPGSPRGTRRRLRRSLRRAVRSRWPWSRRRLGDRRRCDDDVQQHAARGVLAARGALRHRTRNQPLGGCPPGDEGLPGDGETKPGGGHTNSWRQADQIAHEPSLKIRGVSRHHVIWMIGHDHATAGSCLKSGVDHANRVMTAHRVRRQGVGPLDIYQAGNPCRAREDPGPRSPISTNCATGSSAPCPLEPTVIRAHCHRG